MPSFSLSAPSLPPSLPSSFFLSLSLCPVPTDERGTGRAEKRSDIISVGHIPAEGGGSEGRERERDGDWEEEGEEEWEVEEEENVPKLFEVTGSPSPHLPPLLPPSFLDP